jgi:hypothetical protein
MASTIHGVVRGKTIELKENPGVADGQQVEITIKSVPSQRPWGEGLRRCAGALASVWTEDDDRILDEIHADRKRERLTLDPNSRREGALDGLLVKENRQFA